MRYAVKLLTELVPPPAAPRICSHERWDEIQRQLGTVLPDDYLDLARIYGQGSFGDLNFHLETAIAEYTSDKFIQNFNDTRKRYPFSTTIRQHPLGNDEPLCIWPDSPGLFLFADNASSQWLGYYTSGSPNDWTIVVTCDGLCNFINTHLSLSAYLLKCHTSPDRDSIFMYQKEDMDAKAFSFRPVPEA